MMFTVDFSLPLSKIKWPREWLHIRDLVEQFYDSEDVILKSSGSTGTPSSYRFSNRQIHASARRTMKVLGVDGGEAALVLPVDFTGGRMLLYRAMIYRMKLQLHSPSLSIKPTKPVDMISVTPAQWFANKSFLMHCGSVLIGGGELSGEPSEFPSHVLHSYGMTETLSNVALRRPLSDTHFTALDGVRFSQSHDGALIISDSYLGIEALETNDLVELIDDRHFMFRGRRDKVINSGGVKINLDEWLTAWRSISDVDVQPVGMPDDELGQMLVLLVKNDALQAGSLDALFSKLSKHWRPKRVYNVKEFATTSSGKPKIFLHPQDVSELAPKIIKP